MKTSLIHSRFISIVLCCILGASCFRFMVSPESPQWNRDTPIVEVLSYLGAELPLHQLPDSIRNTIEIMRGKDLIFQGKTTGPDGKKSKMISKYYACVNCHNVTREDPDLNNSDPERRLDYAMERKLPFLQATTFHGIVNRESWYNDDYQQQFGQQSELAANDLRHAIRMCATECAHGRALADWEVESILAYLWTLEYDLEDLGFDEEELADLNKTAAIPSTHKSLQHFIQRRYLLKSPAHFGNIHANHSLTLKGDAKRGGAIFELSCMHCHRKGLEAEEGELLIPSFRQLRQKMFKNSNYSLQQIIRRGTLPGTKPHMPHYPLERMSDQQIEDLRAYIETMEI